MLGLVPLELDVNMTMMVLADWTNMNCGDEASRDFGFDT